MVNYTHVISVGNTTVSVVSIRIKMSQISNKILYEPPEVFSRCIPRDATKNTKQWPGKQQHSKCLSSRSLPTKAMVLFVSKTMFREDLHG